MIILDEDIGIKKIKEFHGSIRKEMDANNEVIVDFSKVKRIDLSLVQVILSAGRVARKRGKALKLKGVSDTVKFQMQICGLKT